MPSLPAIGQDPWGDELNDYLGDHEVRIATLEAAAPPDAGGDLESRVADLEARVTALEARPDLVFNSYAYQFSASAPPPTGNEVRTNNADLTQATMIELRKIDVDGADRTAVLRQLRAGSKIKLNDWDVATTYHRYNVTGDVTVLTNSVQIPVTWETGSGTIPNAKINVAVLTELVW